MRVRTDAKRIWQAAISAVQPDSAVRRALETADFTENIHLVAIGKAALSLRNTTTAGVQSGICRFLRQDTLCRMKIPTAPRARQWNW